MPPAVRCPEASSLKEFVLGRLSPAEAEALQGHLLTCGSCIETLRGVRPSDTLIDDLRAGRPVVTDAIASSADVDRVLCKFKHALGQAQGSPGPAPTATAAEHDTPVPEAAEELRALLAPPQGPGEIGWLGPYRVLEVLGSGGMGVVYKAEDPQLKRPVALKAMLPRVAGGPIAKRRFLREAQAAAAIKHDHIVTIHQVGEDRGAPFLAMEFLEGESLHERLKRQSPLPIAEVLRIGRETAEGLAAAHQRGLIHRDIKPANIWLENRGEPGASATGGRVKILDFGLARPAAEEAPLTQTGSIVGTPGYMAPEQAQGNPVDARCDLFSLGVLLYQMSTGQMPFKGHDMMSTLFALATQEPVPPMTVNFDVPAELSDLIMKLLAKSPEARPATARVVADTLERLSKGDAGSVAYVGDAASVATPRRRNRFIFGIGVAAALLLAVGGGGGYRLYQFIIIRDRDGNEVARLKLAKDTRVEIIPEGQADGGKKPMDSKPPMEAAPVPWKPVPVGQSPLDKLDPAQIPAAKRHSSQPKELVAVLDGHKDRVYSVSFSLDGEYLASGSADKTILVRKLAEPEKSRRLETSESMPNMLAFSPDRRVLFAGQWPNYTVGAWDMASGKKSKEYARGHSFALSSKGDMVISISGSSGRYMVWEADSGHILNEWEPDGWAGMAFSPDGKRALHRQGRQGKWTGNVRRGQWKKTECVFFANPMPLPRLFAGWDSCVRQLGRRPNSQD